MRWILVAIVGLVIAYAMNLGLLVYAVYVLAAVMFISYWMAINAVENIAARRTCPQQSANIGNVIPIQLDIEHRGRLPATWVMIEDLMPPAAVSQKRQRMEIDGATVKIARMRGGQKLRLNYKINCRRRGYFQIGPTIIESGDLFGLFRKFRSVSEPDYLLVHPRTILLDGYDVSSRRPIGEVVMTHRLFEDPTRVAGVRQYQTGDPLGRINWRATARTGELQSKVYEPSTLVGASVLIDFHRDSLVGSDAFSRGELAVTAAASICNAVFEMGQQIGFASNGRDAADRIRSEGFSLYDRTGKQHERAGSRSRNEAQRSLRMQGASDRIRPVVVKTVKSPNQMNLISQALARLEPTDALHFHEFVFEVVPRLPRDATVIAILSECTVEMAVALGGLKRQGFAVIVIINVSEQERYATLSGPFVNEGIETRHLCDEESIRKICRKQVLGFATH